jgi:hypothetical protein
MALQQIIYTSAALDDFSEVDLSRLLLKARPRNAALDVTGMLLYHDRSFLQVLEGDPTHVAQVFERIRHDRRHTRILTIMNRAVEERQFRDWAMGFVALKELASSLPGYSDYLRHRGDVTRAGGLADKVLSQFRDGRYRNSVEH